jgi:hypothetical protein
MSSVSLSSPVFNKRVMLEDRYNCPERYCLSRNICPRWVTVDMEYNMSEAKVSKLWMMRILRVLIISSASDTFCQSLFRTWKNTNMTEDQQCSDCLLGTTQLQLDSPLGYQDNIASDFAKTTASCHKNNYPVTKPAPYALNGTSSQSPPTSTPTTSPSCPSLVTVGQTDTCISMSLQYNVSTFSLTFQNKLDVTCQDFPSPGTRLCLPTSCPIYTVKKDDNCMQLINSVAQGYSITQLRAWNPNINALCTNLNGMIGRQICVG